MLCKQSYNCKEINANGIQSDAKKAQSFVDKYI